MSNCNCTTDHNGNCDLTFEVDGTYLAPFAGGSPLEPINLQELVQEAETDTRLQLDATDKNLVYTGEAAQNGGTADTLSLESIFELMQLSNLGDVQFAINTLGDILYYDGDKWVSYTPPTGTIVSSLGVDADGQIVKQVTGGPPPGSQEWPIGLAGVWPGDPGDLPSNFMPLDGREISRTVYAEYYALVGTTYGLGNGTTTFNIPNYNGRTPRGVDASQTEFATVGLTSGAKTHTLTTAQLPSHNHTTSSAGNHTHGYTAPTSPITVKAINPSDTNLGHVPGRAATSTTAAGSHTHTISNTGGGQAHNNLGPTIAQWWVARII